MMPFPDQRILLYLRQAHCVPNLGIAKLPAAWKCRRRAGCSCRRHVAPDGTGRHRARRLRGVTRPEPGLVSGTVEYAVPGTDGGLLWTQSFTARRLDEEMLRRLLGEADLAFGGYLTEDHAWLRAVPA
jgi:hypothetical protein